LGVALEQQEMAELPSVFAIDEDTPKMQEFGLMPSIWYLGHIKKSEIKKTKAGTGLRLNMQVVVEGSEADGFKEDACEQKGRIVFIGLNIENPSAQAVEISQRELASIASACGVGELEDSDELHDISFGFKLGVEKGNDGYEDKNVIKKYVTEKALYELFK
jgi:hypothetical protein